MGNVLLQGGRVEGAPFLTDTCFPQIMHGGLFSEDGVTLDDIRKIERNRQPPDSGEWAPGTERGTWAHIDFMLMASMGPTFPPSS